MIQCKKAAGIIGICIYALMCSPEHYIFAGLNDFKSGTEREEAKKKTSTSKGSSYKNNNNDDEDSIIADLLGEIIGTLWLYGNIPARYAKYPYAKNSENFIFKDPHALDSLDTNDDGTSDNTKNGPELDEALKKTRPFYFTFTGGYQYTDDNVHCGFASLNGKFYKIIGPQVETRYYKDNKDYLSYSMFGVNIPIFQFNILSPDIYFGKAMMRGILDRDGFSVGGDVTLFPFKPLILHGRYGKIYMKNITYTEFGFSAGINYRRCEFFAGYRKISAEYSALKGWEAGIKMWL